MGVHVISSHILVESSAAESDTEFCAEIERLFLQAYGHRPDSWRFSAGVRFLRGGQHFREFACIAGSVSLFLMQRARRNGGFQRAIIYRADEDSVARAFEIRAGEQTEFSPDELHAAEPYQARAFHRQK
ncbi:MAG: hypothetical protein JWM16_2900 [Verrucomicrobiales bacterium]|nr:hypothetical protein [Verrucomicrobiales bacterium]